MLKERFSFTELRIIGISLSILSFGIGIAWFGLFWFGQHKTSSEHVQQNATSSGKLK